MQTTSKGTQIMLVEAKHLSERPFTTLFSASKIYEGVFTCVCFEKIPECFKHCKVKWKKIYDRIFCCCGGISGDGGHWLHAALTQNTFLEELFSKSIRDNISLFLQKHSLSRLRPATSVKKRLWHKCFPMSFAKFLRTPFLT